MQADPPASSTLTPRSPSPWDVRGLDPKALRISLTACAQFVDHLRGAGLDIPRCWYLHGWVLERLLALACWRADEYTASARGAAEWWSNGVMPLTRDWAELLMHGNRHPDPSNPYGELVPLPPIEEVIETIANRAGGHEKED
jgi:hypothetical protein